MGPTASPGRLAGYDENAEFSPREEGDEERESLAGVTRAEQVEEPTGDRRLGEDHETR